MIGEKVRLLTPGGINVAGDSGQIQDQPKQDVQGQETTI